jgi:hypothetical protein
MEVGTWNGHRAVQMIRAAADYHKPSEIHYYGFDLFEGMSPDLYDKELSKWPPSEDEVQKKLEATGAHIHLYKGDTNKTMPDFAKEVSDIEFVFIDGGHAIETVENDWRWTKEVIAPNAIVIFDDYWPKRGKDGGSKLIVDAIDREKFAVDVLPTVDSFSDTDFGPLDIQFAQVSPKAVETRSE